MLHPEGFLDGVGSMVTGWVRLPADPVRRLRVAVLFARAWRVETVADRWRPDLADAGLGDGCCGFAVPMPDALAGREHDVDIRLPDFPEARLTGTPRRVVPVLGPVVVRAARPVATDLERLCLLLVETARLNGGPADYAPDAAAVRDWLAAPDRRWLVVERNGRFIGHCRVGPLWPAEPGNGAVAFGIEVHHDFRGFGLGRQLILAAQRWAAGRHARMELAVSPRNEGALRLYRCLGYVDLGPVEQPDTGAVYRHMAAPLPPDRRPEGTVLIL